MANDFSAMLKSSASPTVTDMLRDAIKVLCQNAVQFEAQLSIQALIGITVDGSEVLLVDIREQIDKASIDDRVHSPMSNQQCNKDHIILPVKQELTDNVTYQESHSNASNPLLLSSLSLRQARHPGLQKANVRYLSGSHSRDIHHDISQGQMDKIGVEDDTVQQKTNRLQVQNFKLERTADIQIDNCRERMNLNGDYAADDDASSADEQFYELITSISTYGGDRSASAVHDIVLQNVDGDPGVDMYSSANQINQQPAMYSQRRNNAGTISSSTLVGRKRKRRATTLSASARIRGSATSATATTAGSSEMYTCEVCGQKIRHRWSFVRHKRQHDGIVYRCEICGRVLNRRDNFRAHQKQCEALCIVSEMFDT